MVGGCRQLCHCRGLSAGGDVLFATSTSRTGHAETLSGALRWLGGLACADLNVWIVATVFARQSGCIALARIVVDVVGLGSGRCHFLLDGSRPAPAIIKQRIHGPWVAGVIKAT